MKNLIELLDSRKPGVNRESIEKAEELLNARFPDEYIELMLLTNNPEFGDWVIYPIKDEQNLKTTWDDIVRQNLEQKENAVPEDMIVIGTEGTGNQLCYRVRKKVMQDQVYVWDHETAEVKVAALSLKELIERETAEYSNATILLGTFQVTSGNLLVSDPCYNFNDEDIDGLQALLKPVKKGIWSAEISYDEYETVHQLTVFWGHTEPAGAWIPIEESIAVDSAQVGVFELSCYYNDDLISEIPANVYEIETDDGVSNYYVVCCDATGSDKQGGTVPGGAVVVSGEGDGLYPAFIKQNESGEIISVMIDFLEASED